ncbi:gamma-glutamylcyclotransferase [Candidatus Azambacteria bacterium]|nr:gamma-glutamylcyclotransferase [Candidatus Azambacteria bacterium]
MQYALFVYGSLRDSALCRKLLERRVGRMRAVLPGFRRARIRGYAYPVARKESKATIRGVLLSLWQTGRSAHLRIQENSVVANN